MLKIISNFLSHIKWHCYEKKFIKYLSKKSFKGLKNKTFSIFASNCTAGFIYQDAGLEYRTPTIGLFFFAPCYINLLKDFKLVNSPLSFVAKSKYQTANQTRERTNNFYPIGLIEGYIEIHFLHYKSVDEAKEKWARRLAKLDYDNLLFLFSVRDLANDQLVKEFAALPFDNKLCLSAKKITQVNSLVYFNQYERLGEMPGADIARISVLRKVDFATVLNNIKKSHNNTSK